MLAVDYGKTRIGLAVSDPTCTIASPIDAINANVTDDPANVSFIARQIAASLIVVGLPISLDGTHGPSARRASSFCRRLRKLIDLPVVLWDERMSTVEAQSRLRAGGNVPTKMRGSQRGRIDSAAAAIILEAYMHSTQRE